MNVLELVAKIRADDQLSNQVDGITNNMMSKFGQAATNVAKLIAGAFATKKLVEFGKASFDAYGEFEQMEGGVRKLYGEMASSTVFSDAANAWRTAQMNSTDYMNTATIFSGRLINELGDSNLAADKVNTAIRAMADNYNTFGTDMGMQITALTSLARGSYRMLDTLAMGLGYGEGQKEFLRFMQDARDYATQISNISFDEYAESMRNSGLSVEELHKRYDMMTQSTDLSNDSFADMITALSILQEKMNVAGTSTKEALSTIQGSTFAAKAAWDNLILEFGKPNGDIEGRVRDLMTTLFGEVQENGERMYGLVNNYKAEITNIISNWMAAIPQIVNGVLDVLPSDVRARVQKVIDVVANFANKVSETFDLSVIGERAGLIIDGLVGAFDNFMATVDFGYLNVIIEQIGNILEQVWGFVEQNIIPHLPEIGTVLGEIVNFMLSVASTALTVLANLGPLVPVIIGALAAVKGFLVIQEIIALLSTVGGIISAGITIVTTFGGVIGTVAAAVGGVPVLIAAVVGALIAFIATNEDAKSALLAAWDAVVNFFNGIPEWWGNLWDSVKKTLSDAIDDNMRKWEEFKENTSQTWEQVKATVFDTASAIVFWMIDRMRELEKFINSAWQSIKNSVSTSLDNISSYASNVWSSIVSTTTSTWNGIASFFSSIWNTMVSTASNAMAWLVNGVVSGWYKALEFIYTIPNTILGYLGNLGNLLWTAGYNILVGLWNGMASAANGFFAWVSSIAGTIARLKGPLPYDRKVLVENGVALMSGLKNGLEKGFENEVKPYVSGMALDVASSINVAPTQRATSHGPVTVSVGELVVREEADINRIAERLYDLSNREASWSMSYSVA